MQSRCLLSYEKADFDGKCRNAIPKTAQKPQVEILRSTRTSSTSATGAAPSGIRAASGASASAGIPVATPGVAAAGSAASIIAAASASSAALEGMRTNWPFTRGRAWASCLRLSYRIFFVKHRFCGSKTQRTQRGPFNHVRHEHDTQPIVRGQTRKMHPYRPACLYAMKRHAVGRRAAPCARGDESPACLAFLLVLVQRMRPALGATRLPGHSAGAGGRQSRARRSSGRSVRAAAPVHHARHHRPCLPGLHSGHRPAVAAVQRRRHRPRVVTARLRSGRLRGLRELRRALLLVLLRLHVVQQLLRLLR